VYKHWEDMVISVGCREATNSDSDVLIADKKDTKEILLARKCDPK